MGKNACLSLKTIVVKLNVTYPMLIELSAVRACDIFVLGCKLA